MIYDIAVLGAGASGLMAAANIKNRSVCIIDSNPKIGEKIRVSGGGKCNITNKYMGENYFKGDKQLIKATLKSFDQKDLLAFLNKNGVFPKIDEKIVKGTYFCKSSNDVINMFQKLTRDSHLRLNSKVQDVDFIEGIFFIKTEKGDIRAQNLIVSSGGLSYPSLGASDIGMKIAQKFGHNVVKPYPALVGFTVQKEQFWFKELSGLSLDVEIKTAIKNIKGKMLFTHKGCSGPAVLSASLYWDKGQLGLNFLPQKDSYLPKRFRQAVRDLDIDLENYCFSPAGNFGFSKAEVTKGGVDTSEVSFEFESRFQKGLFFIGEVLDVTGELGGYNFQWAFSSAFKVAKAIDSNLKSE